MNELQGSERNFQDLVEPPRRLPFSLRLFLMCSRTSSSLALFIFILPFIYILTKESKSDIMLVLVVVVLLLVGIYLTGISLYKGFKNITLISNGRVAQAGLIDKSIRTERRGRSTVTIKTFNFEYSVGGQTHRLQYEARDESTKLVEDEAKEPVIYSEDKPEKGMLLDSLHARIIIDDLGIFRLRRPILGYSYLLLCLFQTAVFVTGIMWIYGKIQLFDF